MIFTAKQHALVQQIGSLLASRKETVAVAESSSGGLASALLLMQPGASAYFRGGTVLYTYEAREQLVGVSREMHVPFGGSTPELVLTLADSLRLRLGSTWAIGEGGAAGPSPSPYGHEAGYTAIAVS